MSARETLKEMKAKIEAVCGDIRADWCREMPAYFSDRISEEADLLVPVYTRELREELYALEALDLGCGSLEKNLKLYQFYYSSLRSEIPEEEVILYHEALDDLKEILQREPDTLELEDVAEAIDRLEDAAIEVGLKNGLGDLVPEHRALYEKAVELIGD